MKKALAIMLMMSLMTVSCGKSGGGSSSEESTQSATDSGNDNDNSASPTPTLSSNLSSQALSFDTNVEYMNLDATQADKYDQAVALVKKVVATEAFRTKVLNHTYGGAKTFVDNRGRTNAQIYQSILDAAESLQPAKNNTMDLGVKMYYENSSVVGFTNGSITYINVNTKFFNNYEINQVAGNLFH